jgi:hypothetical protein
MTVLQAGITIKKDAFHLISSRYGVGIQPARRKGTNMWTFWPNEPIAFPAVLLKTRVFYRPETETYDVCILD